MPTPIEQAASKVMGAAKQVKGAMEGLSGVFRTLIQEHGEVSALLTRLKASNEPDVRARRFPLIRKELLSHEKGELAVVYPEYEQHAETADLAVHHYREATLMEGLIERLSSTDMASESWGQTFDELVTAVQHHVREEENNFFPAGQQVFPNKLDELDRRYHAKKQEILSGL